MKRSSVRYEEECIAHCKVGEINIRFGVVNDLATEIGVHDIKRGCLDIADLTLQNCVGHGFRQRSP